MLVLIDSETRSRCDLKVEGSARYVADPSTELLGACALALSDRHEPVRAWIWTPFKVDMPPIAFDPPREWEALRALPIEVSEGCQGLPPSLVLAVHEAEGGARFAAHNASFDRPILARFTGCDLPMLDTVGLARRCGLPGKLDVLGKYLYGRGKTEGKRSLKLLHSPHERTGEFVAPTGQTLGATMQYCADDVALMAAMYVDAIVAQIAPDPDWEIAFREADAKINARGFGFDSALAKSLVDVDRWVRAREHARILELTDGEVTPQVLGSPQQLMRWLGGRGYYAQELTAPTCLSFIKHPDCDPLVRAVLFARMGHTRIATSKFETGLAQAHEGRIRNSLAYYAAITGREGGRGFQPQNLARPLESIPATAVADAVVASTDAVRVVIEAAEAAKATPDDVISALARSSIVPRAGKMLAVADYSAIEGRGVCWLANDQEGLEVYRSGRDPYVAFASTIYQIPYDELKAGVDAKDKKAKLKRQAGKVGVLGCGYQMGTMRLAAFAAGLGVDLIAAGVTPRQVVEAWRDAHPMVAGTNTGKIHEVSGVVLRNGGLWKALGAAAMDVVSGTAEEVEIGRCLYTMDGLHLICVLPSGRDLVYRNARIAPVVPSWGGDPKPTVTYDKVRNSGVVRGATYGGKLAENITQAICRDLLATALVRLDERGVEVVLHVHDEVVAEVDGEEGLRAVVEAMVEPPSWAKGWPLGVDGFLCRRYGKEAAEGAAHLELRKELL